MSYTLDKDNTIIAVSGNWDAFARANDGADLISGNVIGRQLDQFISGDTTHMFVRTMIMSARILKRPIYRPYRCDSPQLKRYMEMTLHPRADGAVEVVHRELFSAPIVHPVALRAAPDGAGMAFVKRCSLCNRIQSQGIWSELDDAIDADRLRLRADGLRVFYGVCPDCQARRGVPL